MKLFYFPNIITQFLYGEREILIPVIPEVVKAIYHDEKAMIRNIA